LAQLLIETPIAEGGFPMALGVIYCDPAPPFDAVVTAQNRKASAGKRRDLQELLRSGDTWSIGSDQRIGNASSPEWNTSPRRRRAEAAAQGQALRTRRQSARRSGFSS